MPPKSLPPYRCHTTEISFSTSRDWGTGKRDGARSRSELPRGREKYPSFTRIGPGSNTVTTGSPSRGYMGRGEGRKRESDTDTFT